MGQTLSNLANFKLILFSSKLWHFFKSKFSNFNKTTILKFFEQKTIRTKINKLWLITIFLKNPNTLPKITRFLTNLLNWLLRKNNVLKSLCIHSEHPSPHPTANRNNFFRFVEIKFGSKNALIRNLLQINKSQLRLSDSIKVQVDFSTHFLQCIFVYI